MQIVSEPLPSEDLLDREARVAVSKRQEEVPAGDQHKRDNEESDPSGEHALACESLACGDVVLGAGSNLLVLGRGLIDGLRVEDKFEEGTSNQARGQVGREIMMQEKLSSHEVEWEVMGGPGQPEEASRVVESRASAVIQGINAAAEGDLIGQDNTGVDGQQTAGKPPADRVAEEVDLLASLVLSPEADTSEQEGPLVRVARVGVAAGQLAVVVEHGSLQLKPLLQEGQVLNLALRLLAASVIGSKGRNILYNPDVGARGNLLVSVDFLLFVSPLRQGLGVSPHGNLAGVVNKLEVARDRLEVLVVLAMLNSNLKESIVLALAKGFLSGNTGELLVGGVVRRGNIVGEEDLVSAQMTETNEIVVLNIATSRLVTIGGENLPVVVGIVVRISGNLLALAGDTAVIVSERVLVLVAVEIGLGFLVSNGDAVIVLDVDCVGEHDVVAEGLLEFRGHEVVTGTGPGEDSEMNLEPEEVEEEGHQNETEGASSEVLAKFDEIDRTLGSVDVEKVPEVNDDGGADGDEGESTDVLGGHVTGQGKACEDEPLPPLPREGLVSELVELNIEEQAASHGENQGGIQENEAGLANVGVVKEDQTSGEQASGKTVARLPHDEVRHGDGEGTEDSRQGTVSHVGDLVGDVGVANVLKVEATIVADQPAHEGEEELAEGRVDIEEVGSLEVVGGELSKVHLIEDDLVRMANTPESSDKSQNSGQNEADLVVAFVLGGSSLSASLCKLVEFGFGRGRSGLGLFRGRSPLSQAALRRGRTSHDGSRIDGSGVVDRNHGHAAKGDKRRKMKKRGDLKEWRECMLRGQRA